MNAAARENRTRANLGHRAMESLPGWSLNGRTAADEDAARTIANILHARVDADPAIIYREAYRLVERATSLFAGEVWDALDPDDPARPENRTAVRP